MAKKSILDYNSMEEYILTLDEEELEKLGLQGLVEECVQRGDDLKSIRERNRISTSAYKFSLKKTAQEFQSIAYHIANISNYLAETIKVAQTTKVIMGTASSSLEETGRIVKAMRDREEIKMLESMPFDGRYDS